MLKLFVAYIRAVGASEVLLMNHMAAARYSCTGCGLFARSWPYQGRLRLLIVLMVVLLGGSPLAPRRVIAGAGQNVRPAHPIADQSQDLAGPVSTQTNGIGTSLPVGNRAPDLPEPLRAALAFNIFITGDLTQRQAITYGRVAVGGNATLERYRIGDTMSRSRDNRADLIVGGTLIFTDGLLAKGGIIAGGKASLAKVGIPHGQLREGLPIDFGAQSAALAQLAASLNQLPANGITQIRQRRNMRKQIILSGTDRQINIFALAGNDLADAETLIFSMPQGATALVNIDGAADQIQNIGFAIGNLNRQRILYNFYEATELTLNDDRIQGTILAPHARVTFVSGRVNGTLIGATLTGTGVAWPAPFIRQLPDAASAAGTAARAGLATISMPTTLAQ